jgi:hypothetical protein
MTPGAATALQKGIGAIMPPANPQTPKIRQDPSMERLIDQQRIRISVQRAMDNEEDGAMQQVYAAMKGAIMQALLGMQGTEVLTYLQQASAPSGAMMGSGAPGSPPQSAPAAAPMAPPPQGGMAPPGSSPGGNQMPPGM